VPYKIVHRDGKTEIISNPAEFPDPHEQSHLGVKLYEPMVDATMIFPSEYLGDVIELCEVIYYITVLMEGKSRNNA
jgi:translation elongation factor EF-4